MENLLKLGKLNLTVKSATKILFQGEVAAVSFSNKLGPFDVLPNHKNLVALVTNKIILHFDETRKTELALDRGVMKVTNNVVTVYVGI